MVSNGIRDRHSSDYNSADDRKCSAMLPSLELQAANRVHDWGVRWHRVQHNSRLNPECGLGLLPCQDIGSRPSQPTFA